MAGCQSPSQVVVVGSFCVAVTLLIAAAVVVAATAATAATAAVKRLKERVQITMTSSSASSEPSHYFYFGYGPIVNPLVRQRREVRASHSQAAVLPEHRLTFAFGGVVNIVPQRGYEVYGVLLTFDRLQDWQDFQKFDAGYNLDEVRVILCDTPEGKSVKAFTFVMKEFDGEKLDGNLEKLPQERYLKLIASGLRAYQVDSDYIEDCIMGVPYTPKTKPQDYKSFPQAKPVLPTISFRRYEQNLCKNAAPGQTFFIIGTKVIQLDPHDVENPCAVWIREKAHGEPDITLTLHKGIVDPDIPPVDLVEELTPLHYRWCENHFIEYLAQGDITASAVFRIDDSLDLTNASSGSFWWRRWCCYCCVGKRPADSSPHHRSGALGDPLPGELGLERESGRVSEDSPTQEISFRDLNRGNDGDTDEEDMSTG